jgi:hypothetical protein
MDNDNNYNSYQHITSSKKSYNKEEYQLNDDKFNTAKDTEDIDERVTI